MADDIRLVIGVDDRDLIRTQKEQKKFERNILIIEAAFRKGDITAKRYAGELNKQAKQMSRLGGTYNKANSEVRTYAATVRKLTHDQLKLTMAQNVAGKSTNKFGMYAQQVGYQVGDFFVQVQSGTSALVAFGQQGTQLAGLLPGVTGAIVGIGLSVGTMLLRSFNDASGSSKTFSKALEETETALKDYATLTEAAAASTAELSERFGMFASSMNLVLEDLKTLGRQEAIKKFEEQINNLSLATQSWRGSFVTALNGSAEGVKLLTRELGLTVDQYIELSRLGKETKDGPIEGRVQAAIALRDALLEATGGIEKMTPKMSAYFTEVVKSIQAGSELNQTIETSLEIQSEHYQDIVGGAWGLAEAEAAILKIKEKAEEVEKKIADRQDAKYSSQQAALELSLMQANLEQQYEDKLYIQNLIARQKIRLQIESKEITAKQGEELLKLTDQLLDQKQTLRDITVKEKERLELIKQQDLFMKKNPLDPFGGKGKFIPNYVKDDKKKKVADPFANLQKQLKLERALVGQTTARKRVLNALGVDQSKWSTSAIAKLEAEVVAVEKLQKAEEERIRVIEEAKRQQEELAATIETSMGDAFMAMSDGTKSVSDAFRTMAAEVVRELYKVYVMQVAIAAIKTFAGGFFADGGAFSGGKEVTAYANGGVVNGPTNFAMAGGKTGLMGEAGPEAIMPLKRGANGKLGVQMEGGGGSTHVTNNYNISANTSEDTKRLVTQTIQQAQPALTQAAKASMMNDRRRGGQMKSVFG
tara:strand:- start:5182 stop:7461 length:2280 start_codon:yes stop_codon:yes gene_type:complete